MRKCKVVLVTSTYDQGDILEDYLNWHLHLEIDHILVQDFGSTDGSRDILDDFSRRGRVQSIPFPGRNMLKHSLTMPPLEMARDQHQADWVINADADEFLCVPGGDLKALLRQAEEDGVTSLSCPCQNMTGLPPLPGERATQTLNLRVQRPVRALPQQQVSGSIPVPFIFVEHPPHTIAWARAVTGYGPGAHSVSTSYGKSAQIEGLHFLHYIMRGYDTFQKKIGNAIAWFEDNPSLERGWAWHWRRWITLERQGRLHEDYAKQFVTANQAQALVQAGICAVETSITDWLAAIARKRGHELAHTPADTSSA